MVEDKYADNWLHLNELSQKKQSVTTFLQGAASGNAGEVFQRFCADNFMHHNPFFLKDPKSLHVGMEESARKFPQKSLKILRMVEEGDTVVCHSHIRMDPNDLGVSVVHIFRFKDNKIFEMWDIGQPVPVDMVNENGMF